MAKAVSSEGRPAGGAAAAVALVVLIAAAQAEQDRTDPPGEADAGGPDGDRDART
jgi:hypothetical protein